jgi:hypothetical protein
VGIASLTRLNNLDLLYIEFEEEAISSLAKCKELRILRGIKIELLGEVLPVIGRKLVSLSCDIKLAEDLERIIEYCPNLECLDIFLEGVRDDNVKLASMKRLLVGALRRLSDLDIDG